MERITRWNEGFEYVNSDLCTTVYGGRGLIGRLVRKVVEHIDEFIIGFIEGWTGEDLSELTR